MTKTFEIRSGLLARNTILNLAGMLTPLIVGVIAVPFLIRGLGIDRFGVLTLMWVVAGYMALLDFGLGRALTQLIAERLGKGQADTFPGLAWTSLAVIFALGALAGLALALISPVVIHRILRVASGLQGEALTASYVLALSVPFVFSINGLRGILEALQRFDLSNAIRIPTGAFSFLGPLLVLVFSHSLVAVVAVMVAGRFVSWIVHLMVCLSVMPELRRPPVLNGSELRGLICFGGWVTVSNVVGPVMTYFDRFLIGGILSMAEVAFYATPFDFVTKLNTIPMAIVGVLYPAFAACYHTDHPRTAALFKAGAKYVFIILFPVVIVIVTFARNALSLWLGEGFASRSAGVLEWLAVGVLINGLATIPFGLIQGAGRPDLIAKLHVAELAPYGILVWWLVHAGGIDGVAIAWVIRVSVDALALFVIAKRLLPGQRVPLWRGGVIVTLWLSVLALSQPVQGAALRSVFTAAVLMIFAAFSWFLLLSEDERKMFKQHWRAVRTLGQLSGDRA